MKIVKFRSPEIAEKVQAHLYDVTIDKDELRFSNFDLQAFNCVTKLENLDRGDYSFVDSESKNEEPWITSPYVSRQTRITLEFAVNILALTRPTFLSIGLGGFTQVDRHYFSLLVCNTFQYSEDVTAIPLAINSELFYFATLIKTIAEGIVVPIPMINTITSAICIKDTRNDPTSYVLKFEANGEIQSYQFFPSNLSINASQF